MSSPSQLLAKARSRNDERQAEAGRRSLKKVSLRDARRNGDATVTTADLIDADYEAQLAEIDASRAADDLRVAEQADRAAAADALCEAVVESMANEDANVERSLAAVKAAIPGVMAAARQRESTRRALLSQLATLGTDSPRFIHDGAMARVDGKPVLNTTERIASEVCRLVADAVGLGHPALADSLRALARFQAPLTQFSANVAE